MKINILNKKFIPCVIPNWDNSPRSGLKSLILTNARPETFKKYMQKLLNEYVKFPANPPFIVIKSWNEWAEGNYLEPDKKYGTKWLEMIKKTKEEFSLLND